jgi:hypothetical protein
MVAKTKASPPREGLAACAEGREDGASMVVSASELVYNLNILYTKIFRL